MYESFTFGQYPFRTMTLAGQGKVTANPEYYYRQALNMAVADAIGKAESISANLGIQVESIPGNVTIDASVTAEFLY